MIRQAYLILAKSGIRGVRKTRPPLKWDEISMKIELDIPKELFERPQLEANIRVDPEKVQPNQINPDIILNTKELIEQSTGVKIDFKVLPIEKDGEKSHKAE